MLFHDRKTLMVSGAFVAVSAFAATGWLRNTGPHPLAASIEPVAYTAPVNPCGSQGFAATPVTYGGDGYYPSVERPVYVRESAYQQPAPQYAPQYAPSPSYSRPVRVRQGRSKRQSAAIVAGSAGVGAAIGAIAGGGPGAAIGAISGGSAGFVYDRLTHNK